MVRLVFRTNQQPSDALPVLAQQRVAFVMQTANCNGKHTSMRTQNKAERINICIVHEHKFKHAKECICIDIKAYIMRTLYNNPQRA